jgi:glycosyltransferase involved in cell wall biosynthesis
MKVLMVSIYPPTRCGVAYYTYYLVKYLRKEGCNITLLTDKEWKRNDLLLPLKVFVKSLDHDIVHIQHEFLLYGHPYTIILIILSLILLRIKRFSQVSQRKSLLQCIAS